MNKLKQNRKKKRKKDCQYVNKEFKIIEHQSKTTVRLAWTLPKKGAKL